MGRAAIPLPPAIRGIPMTIEVLRAKIHRVRVTEAEINYIGSITLDEDLIDAAGLVEGEKVQVLNVNNGDRLYTYVIKGARGSGVVCLNGPAARRVTVGDIVIVVAYAHMTIEEARSHRPTVIFPDERTNKLVP
ncbi:MAG: Aspartate 1-decarboxylase [Flavobacteriales bacterium]|nr:Aspartate 1-decarboxylase [Flavobacteriales bacterium]